jgi:hypothetical protein
MVPVKTEQQPTCYRPTSDEWGSCTGALHPSLVPCDIPIVVRTASEDGFSHSWAEHVSATELAAEVRRLRGDSWLEPYT